MIDKKAVIIGIFVGMLIGIILALLVEFAIYPEKQTECMNINGINGVMLFDEYIIDNSDVDNHPDYTFYLKGYDIATIKGSNLSKDNNSYCYNFKPEQLHYPYNENGIWVWK